MHGLDLKSKNERTKESSKALERVKASDERVIIIILYPIRDVIHPKLLNFQRQLVGVILIGDNGRKTYTA